MASSDTVTVLSKSEAGGAAVAISKGAGIELFIASLAILFLELAAIRWFAAYVVTLSFFTNFVLLAAFLGMSAGCLAAGRRPLIGYFPGVFHLTCFATLAFYAATGYFFLATVDVQGSGAPDIVYFGTERVGEAALKPGIPLAMLLAGLFVALVAWFYPLGQIMGLCFERIPNRIVAYTINIGGSLVGIGAFALFSAYSAPPFVWFATVVVIVVWFLVRFRAFSFANLVLLGTTLAMIGIAGWRAPGHRFFWSPYYCIRLSPSTLDVVVNGISHQRMVKDPWQWPPYRFPFVLFKRAFGRVPDRVLIIGAGTGNDVAAALWAGVRHIDAVEIDPVIAEIGRRYHPNRPYDDPRVHLVIDDGRAFLRRSREQYDLILYGLVDSLTLQSGMANVRLETYLFTVEAFQEVRARLKPDGLFVATNFFREGWIVHRLAGMAKEAFGEAAAVVQFPSRPELSDRASRIPGAAAVVASLSDRLDGLLQPNAPLCLGCEHTHKPGTGGDCDGPVVYRSKLVASRHWELPTDDWPFLYLREPRIPRHNLVNLAVVLLIAVLLIFAASPRRGLRIDPAFFCLGAGFMLIETKGVVELARVFGSTWVVNSFVFGGVLVAILLANLFVLWFNPTRLSPWFAGLLLALAAAWLVPLDWFAGLPYGVRAILAVSLEFTPILFAGVVFAILFRATAHPAEAYGANILGAMVGGMLEYLSLVSGYSNLVLIAGLLYLGAALGSRWLLTRPAVAARPPT